MPGKVKRCGYISYGYCGWHETWNGEKVFLRSAKEFIYARVLDLNKVSYKTEMISYIIGEKTYKPDFFIFNAAGDLEKIVEIKGSRLEGIKAKEMYDNFFENVLKIPYEVLWAFDKLITKHSLQNDIEAWIQKSIVDYNKISYAGENNPRFGQHCTEDTKKKISQRAKERFQNSEYKENIRQQVTAKMNNIDYKLKVYKKRTINFSKKVMEAYNLTADEFILDIDFYSNKAKEDKILQNNSGLSFSTFTKYGLTKEDLQWQLS